MRQGDALASAGFCVGIHPEVRALDAELAPSGGAARFLMDDGYAVGPPHLVFPAVLRFAERVAALGLELQLHKCTCYSRGGHMATHPDRPRLIKVGSVTGPNGAEAFGIEVAGVPVGDDAFVMAVLDSCAGDSVSKITSITEKLRDHHLQSLHAMNTMCLQPILHFWSQHCYPHLAAPAARKVDEALSATAQVCYGTAVVQDPVATKRLRLPARMYGGGLRCLADVASAAFVGNLCQAVPALIDRADAYGRVTQGFMPSLRGLLGEGSFDEGNEEFRFHGLLASGVPSANVFLSQWEAMRQEVGPVDDGPLSQPARAAGAGVGKMQRSLTRQREQVRFQTLDVEIRALPAGDMRRAAWVNLNRFSTVWVTALPGNDAAMTNAEFQEVSTFYYGLPSPACAPVVGQRIAGTRATVDPHGCRLTTATLPGDGWRTQHDAIKWRIHEDAKEMHVRTRPEVYGLFAACIPQEGRSRADAQPARKRQGLVPDMMMTLAVDGPERALLYEIKTLHFGASTYGHGARRCEAVAKRARALPTEYAAKARHVDRKFCGTPEGQVGPVETRLRTYDPVRGLVFGAWGEASPATEELLTALATAGAERHWRAMRCPDPDAAVGPLAWMLRRRWALTALRENARLKLERLEFVGRGSAAAVSRRTAAQDQYAARARRAAVSMARGPRALMRPGA